MAEENVDMSWDFEVNLSGISAPKGKAVVVPEGYYKVKLTKLYVNTEKNPNRVVIMYAIEDGPFKGRTLVTGLNRPKDAEDKVRYYWRALAESAGYTSAQLDAGAVKLGPAAFDQKVAWVRYTPRPDENSYEEHTFLAPSEWQLQSKAFTENGGAAAAQAAANTTSTAVGGNATKTKADVLKQLGI